MDIVVWWVLLLLLAITVFALGNPAPIALVFWQWSIYSGSLTVAIIGAVAIGGLLTLLPALLRQPRLARRIRDLEREKDRDDMSRGAGAARSHRASAEDGAPSLSGMDLDGTGQ